MMITETGCRKERRFMNFSGAYGRMMRIVWLITLSLVGACFAEPVGMPASPMPVANSFPSGRLNVGIQFSEQQSESFGDILIPLYQRRNTLLFINPRGSWNDDESRECSVGLGARHLFAGKNMIVGANLFYDRQNTTLDNTFNQAGLGLEWLSEWVDARLNVYLPEQRDKNADDYVVTTATTQEHSEYWYAPAAQGHVISQYGYETTDSYSVSTLHHYQTAERGMDGFDAEIGSLLILPFIRNYADIKAFVGLYQYNAEYGDGISGMKARLEIRPLPAVYLDAGWVEDEELVGSQYSIGVRATVPFDLVRLSRGHNPFAGALAGFKPGVGGIPFASRLTEMVMRDLHVRTEVLDPVEVVADRRMLEKKLFDHDRRDFIEIIASDVTFVDGDNVSGLENGTWENPFRQMNAGVQNAIGSMVYVSPAAGPYLENVVLRQGLTLWGSGVPLQGPHGAFGGTVYPVVNGGGKGPVITLANDVRVTGFELVQPAGSLLSSPVILGEDVSGVTISQNTIQGNGAAGAGIQLRAVNRPAFLATLWGNRIAGASGDGISIDLTTVPQVDLTVDQNAVAANGGAGFRMAAMDGDNVHLRISGDYSGNGGDGVAVHAFTQEAIVKVSHLTAYGNGGSGVMLDLYGYQKVQVVADTLEASHNHLDGVHAGLISGGSVSVAFDHSRLIGNDGNGCFLELNSGLDSCIVARANEIAHNGANGMCLRTLAPWDSVYDFGQPADSGLNVLAGNGAYQMVFDGAGTVTAAGNWWGTPTPVEHVEYQDQSGGTISVVPPLSARPTP
jgi:hypothetical protein